MTEATTYHPHYTSTYCIHADHAHCPLTCKTCKAFCLCHCHKPKAPEPEYARLTPCKRRADDGHLTPRERQITSMIADGLSTKEIAGKLGLAFKTVVCHRGRILHKTGAANAAQLTRYAIREGLVRDEPARAKAETA